VERRQFLGLLALGVLESVAGCGQEAVARPSVAEPRIPPPVPGRATTIVHSLTRNTRQIALTIDDGFDAETVAAYVKMAVDTGIALTFNPVGRLAHTWEPHAKALAPLVERGQVQIGNHTYHHLDLRKLSDARVRSEIEQNEEWIERTFKVTARPYLRPPSGLHDTRVNEIAGSLGYTKLLLWDGSFEDAVTVSAQALLANAQAALQAGAIVVGHANVETVTRLYPQIIELIKERHLQPVTLDQMFATSRVAGR
jgi:peptidoglycan/xylan/chitin deacetylase (PgdA/CDA1 family)